MCVSVCECVCVGVRVCVLTMTERVIGFAAGEDR